MDHSKDYVSHLRKLCVEGKLYQYETTASCFPDAINAFHLLLSGSNFGKYKIIYPSLKTYWDGEVAITFYSQTKLADLKKIWSEALEFGLLVRNLKTIDNSY